MKYLARLLSVLSLVIYSGCATYNSTAPLPAINTPVRVALSEEHLKKMTEIPVGVFYDESRRVALAGHQGGVMLGIMFGPLGVLAADKVNKDIGEKKLHSYTTDHENEIVMDLAREAVSREMADLNIESAGHVLHVAPFVVITADKQDQATFYALLKARIENGAGEEIWQTRVFAQASGLKPLKEGEGWSEPENFVGGAKESFGQAAWALSKILGNDLPIYRKGQIKARYPYLKEAIALNGVIVDETDQHYLVRTFLADAMVFSGYQVLLQSDVEYTPKDVKDPTK